ncbi:uncharacterized protein E0L32_009265 [Thyridium curvatum]|uniref:Uncharacterized protein n=1 Tax=Thyridium curvatum TaxID=1093900 RepID=A0A507AJE3_9PEZI|nr:uncharacterized protein E0L32_009265 [Thyridium curvatum]TPX09522.1 hypothetical protein E0L32_009265 [Thyridium curvatum]
MALVQPLIWINGWPGVGKQTVSQCFTALAGADKAILIDSYQFTDHLDLPPAALHSQQSSQPEVGLVDIDGNNTTADFPTPEEREEQRRARRDACFARYVEGPDSLGRAVIFTDCQPDDAAGRAEAREYERAAARAGRPFAPVYLACGEEERRRRVGCAAMRQGGKAKRCLAARAARSRGGGRLFRFEGHEGLVVDVTERTAHEATMEILVFVNVLMERLVREGEGEAAGVSSEVCTPVEGREPEWREVGGR